MKIQSRDNTHKKDIVSNIFKKVGVPSVYGMKLIDDIILIMLSNVLIKKSFKIKNFGSFTLTKKKKRIGRNPKNEVNYEILERNVLTFKAANELKRKINIDAKK